MSQPSVGFLTILERLHYCTVGWNLKNPLHPVWVLASETHLSGEEKQTDRKDRISASSAVFV